MKVRLPYGTSDVDNSHAVTGLPSGQVLFCSLASVVIYNAAGRRAGDLAAVDRQARGWLDGRHCPAGHCGYVPLGRHFVFLVVEQILMWILPHHQHQHNFCKLLLTVHFDSIRHWNMAWFSQYLIFKTVTKLTTVLDKSCTSINVETTNIYNEGYPSLKNSSFMQ